MVKAIVTPTHANALEALLNQSFTGTLHHSRAQGEVQILKDLMLSGRVMLTLKENLHRMLVVGYMDYVHVPFGIS